MPRNTESSPQRSSSKQRVRNDATFRSYTSPPSQTLWDRYAAGVMFGALNRFIARLDSDPPQQSSTTSQSDNSFGFQVLRNTNAELTLEPWFDFIIGINGRLIVSRCHVPFGDSGILTPVRITQIHSFSPGRSAIALAIPSPLRSGAQRYAGSRLAAAAGRWN